MTIGNKPIIATVGIASAVGLFLFGAAMPAVAASLHGPLDGRSADLMGSVPVAAPAPATVGVRGTVDDARTYFEPERFEPAAETCTFSLDALCSDDTDWLNRDVFGTEYRFDPSDDAQGAPSDGDLGLAISSGLTDQGADGRSSMMDSLSKGALLKGTFSAD
ncbi:MAG: hypothetical protein NXH97_06930 [Rhodobacteraceae bacterium]|nr:hypothetical protein [Paracoccaceae bacterium]